MTTQPMAPHLAQVLGSIRRMISLKQLPDVYPVNRRACDDARPRGNGDAGDGGSGETGPDPRQFPLEVLDGIFHAARA